ncbi:MAG TPA: CDP-diacylglycerol--glycerol-3-phosphate 3-phosphatidyltransferase [Oligoflexia bacterium]|nr:CDP-diacylglycerol--glycerol-3-phosphate 3-phosphatidyltransferase [Oligoflexia bacterium]HMP27659.1 CDP-diacylglycerol--glycerol-3-phosphate 3-phosphatidyltransferase [Oligoflexia bacterium]
MLFSLNNLPNLLTIFRVVIIPIFIWLLVDPSRLQINLAIIIFTIAACTDFLDGFLARKLRVVSDFGKLLDPLADKILVMSALVLMINLRSEFNNEPWVPAWMVVLVLMREMWVTGIRGIAATKGIVISAADTAKWKSALQMISIIFLLLHDLPILILNKIVSAKVIGLSLLSASLMLSYITAFNYTVSFFSRAKLNND